ncbi:MAG: amino-acid N-acetyltransferase [Betaproteobacteria bacterium]|nr:amino-acid N-acetyltransferase [Betaproteobacteria bacterium]
MNPVDQSLRRIVAWVRDAAPYVHAFRGRVFVIAFGGEVAAGPGATALAQDCNLLAALGVRMVLVHGARPQIDAEMQRRGLEPHYHHGLRVTDAEALACVKAGNGVTRIEIEALLSQGLPGTPMAGAAMRVAGGNFVVAKPVGVVDGMDMQYTGRVRRIAVDALRATLEQHNVVLISPLGVSPSGETFNLSLEEVAQAVAVELRAEKLIFMCDVPGVTDAGGELLRELTADEAERILHSGQALSEDLGFYLPWAVAAVRGGVGRAHLISEAQDGALLLEVFTREGIGTVITRDPLARIREATVEDVGEVVRLIAPLEADGTLVRRGREVLEMEIGRFSVLEHDGVIRGCAALYPFSADRAAELACLAVHPESRRAGFGEAILSHMLARAKAAGLERLFVLTTRTAHWFLERGFVAVPVDLLPAERRELYNLQRRSKVLMRTL